MCDSQKAVNTSTPWRPAIAASVVDFDVRVISTQKSGLAAARNVGLRHASGEIVAYLDDDASPDPDWLRYLAVGFMTTPHAAIGGPNVPPADGFLADCIAKAPGGPILLIRPWSAHHEQASLPTRCIPPAHYCTRG